MLAEGPVTRVFPETAKLYARLPGRPTPADPGLLIRDVITHREGSGADQSIVIEGAVVNEAKTPVPLPALAIAVTAVMEGERATAAGDVIASEVVRFAEPTLAPGRVATFHARFDRVPPGPVQVRATFATPPETR